MDNKYLVISRHANFEGLIPLKMKLAGSFEMFQAIITNISIYQMPLHSNKSANRRIGNVDNRRTKISDHTVDPLSVKRGWLAPNQPQHRYPRSYSAASLGGRNRGDPPVDQMSWILGTDASTLEAGQKEREV